MLCNTAVATIRVSDRLKDIRNTENRHGKRLFKAFIVVSITLVVS